MTDPNFVPDTNNSAYIIFMLIAIVGYFTIPTVSTWVIQAAGAGNYGKQVNNSAVKTAKWRQRLPGLVPGMSRASCGANDSTINNKN